MFCEESFANQIDLRFSNASTVDFSDSEDDCQCLRKTKGLDEESLKKTFEDISTEQKTHYLKLKYELSLIYEKLSEEIEPICVRETCGLLAKSIDLCSVANSQLTRRRRVYLK